MAAVTQKATPPSPTSSVAAGASSVLVRREAAAVASALQDWNDDHTGKKQVASVVRSEPASNASNKGKYSR